MQFLAHHCRNHPPASGEQYHLLRRQVACSWRCCFPTGLNTRQGSYLSRQRPVDLQVREIRLFKNHVQTRFAGECGETYAGPVRWQIFVEAPCSTLDRAFLERANARRGRKEPVSIYHWSLSARGAFASLNRTDHPVSPLRTSTCDSSSISMIFSRY